MKKLHTENEFTQALHAAKPLVAVFKADWCKDCHYIEPFMPDVEKKYEDRLHFIEIDRDQFPELCDRYQVLGIPSFIAFKDGKELVRFVSKLRKTREEIEQFFDRACEVAEAM